MVGQRFMFATKRIFISFDFEHDRNYRYLLSALNENTSSEIVFEDFTPSEIQSTDIGRIKAALARKLGGATHTLVIIGKNANSPHPDRVAIGARNWQWWEIEKSKELRKKLIAVKIERSNATPTPLLNTQGTWAHSFNVPAIVQAIASAQ